MTSKTIEEAGWIGPLELEDGEAQDFINWHGEWVLTVPYNAVGEFRAGVAAFLDGGRLGFIDMAGSIVIKPIFDAGSVYPPVFREGLAPVRFKGAGTLVNAEGEIVVEPRSNAIYWNFVDGKALMATAGKVCVIDRSWRELSVLDVCEVPYLYDFPLDWGCFPCLMYLGGEHRRAYINWRGDFVFPPVYSEVGPFEDGIAPFSADDQFGPWGLVRMDGEVILPPTFYSIGSFVNGIAPAAKEKKKFGYINRRGDWVIPPLYQQACSFSDGLACVTVASKGGRGNKGFINSSGEVVIEPRFFRQGSFCNGWAYMEYEGMNQVIDRTGKVIWESPVRVR